MGLAAVCPWCCMQADCPHGLTACRIARHIAVMHACCTVSTAIFVHVFSIRTAACPHSLTTRLMWRSPVTTPHVSISNFSPCPVCPPQFDDEADVAAVWREVWEESTASSGAGLRLHMAEVVQVRLFEVNQPLVWLACWPLRRAARVCST